jgi:hypothetical protein
MTSIIKKHGPSAMWVSAILLAILLVTSPDHKVNDALAKQCLGACDNEKLASTDIDKQKTTQ